MILTNNLLFGVFEIAYKMDEWNWAYINDQTHKRHMMKTFLTVKVRSEWLDILRDLNKFPTSVHALGETLLFFSIDVIDDVVAGKTFLHADVSEVLQHVQLLHEVVGKNGLSLLFASKHLLKIFLWWVSENFIYYLFG